MLILRWLQPRFFACAFAILLASVGATGVNARPKLATASLPTHVVFLDAHVGGRADVREDTSGRHYTYQWPGTYFEAAFKGSSVWFQMGQGDRNLIVTIDDKRLDTLEKPRGAYKVSGLGAGAHVIRLDSVTENRFGPMVFDGFWLDRSGVALSAPARPHQIEFVGDSHTVGFANLSNKLDCTDGEIWQTTDTSQAFAPRIARSLNTDFQILAISGRGIVRNYDGSKGDPLPKAYPYVLFDKATAFADSTWHPDIVVISLGTNDFSTPLHDGETWTSEEALRLDYEQTFAAFLAQLRSRYPKAYILLWATDMADGEIIREMATVSDRVRRAGDTAIDFIAISDLQMSSCHGHPNLADDMRIADVLSEKIALHQAVKPLH